MVTRIHSKNIIGDFYIAEFLSKKKPDDEFFIRIEDDFDHEKKYGMSFLPIKVNDITCILLNTGIDCFSNEPFGENEEIIFNNTHTYNHIIQLHIESIENPKVNKVLKTGAREFYSKGLEMTNLFTTIKVKRKDQRFYVVDKDHDCRIFTHRYYKDEYNNYPLIKIVPYKDTYELLSPIIVFPNSLSLYLPKISFAMQEEVGTNTTTKNPSYELIKMILMYGQNMKDPVLENRDMVFIKIENVSFGKILLKDDSQRDNFESFCLDFFKNEYELFLSFSNQINIVYRYGNVYVQNDPSQYSRLIKQINKKKLLISWCIIKNCDLNVMGDQAIVDVDSYEAFFGKPKMEISIPVIITEEEAQRNAEELIAQEEAEKRRKEKQKSRKKKKITPNIENLKRLAKKITYEVKVHYSKNERLNKIKRNIEKYKKILSTELLEYFEQKQKSKLDIPEIFEEVDDDSLFTIEEFIPKDDNQPCNINSEEYQRRVKEWDFTQIIPDIYCYPKDYVISLFTRKNNQKDLWLFDLW